MGRPVFFEDGLACVTALTFVPTRSDVLNDLHYRAPHFSVREFSVGA
jgi:hypothetical protein